MLAVAVVVLAMVIGPAWGLDLQSWGQSAVPMVAPMVRPMAAPTAHPMATHGVPMAHRTKGHTRVRHCMK